MLAMNDAVNHNNINVGRMAGDLNLFLVLMILMILMMML